MAAIGTSFRTISSPYRLSPDLFEAFLRRSLGSRILLDPGDGIVAPMKGSSERGAFATTADFLLNAEWNGSSEVAIFLYTTGTAFITLSIVVVVYQFEDCLSRLSNPARLKVSSDSAVIVHTKKIFLTDKFNLFSERRGYAGQIDIM